MRKGGEEDQTLNQLLVEMDGMESDRGVIVLASTNSDRHESEPWSLAGGEERSLTSFAATRDGRRERAPRRATST